VSAADVLSKHRYAKAACDGCCKSYGYPDRHAAHQIDALKAAGFIVIDIEEFRSNRAVVALLPEPESVSPHSWLDGSVTATRGLGKVRLYQDDPRMTAEDARGLAAALLAAAAAAEVS
jgi:hypothetical protein